MIRNLFFKKENRHVYNGTKEAASPIRETHTLPTDREAKIIDSQEKQIRSLEKEAKNNSMLRFYIYGY